MPKGDHTGPMGMGPKTGRGFGYCAGNASSFLQGGRRSGFSDGFRANRAGYGRRLWCRFNPNRFSDWGQYYGRADVNSIPMSAPMPDPETEKQMLQNQSQALQTQLDLTNKRLNVLEKEETKGSVG